jgi:hypothetical protein
MLSALVFSLAMSADVPPSVTASAPATQTVERRKTWLWATGLAIVGAGWLGTGVVTSILCRDTDPAPCQPHVIPTSWLPIVGPWIILPTANGPAQRAILTAVGVLEIGGLAMLILGLVLKERVDVPVAGGTLRLLPVASASFAGARASFEF